MIVQEGFFMGGLSNKLLILYFYFANCLCSHLCRVLYIIEHRMYSRAPQIFHWRANLLQSLAPILIKLTYLRLSNDLEDSD